MGASFFLFLVAAFFSEIIGTVTGFGITTLLLPVATFFLDIKTAIALVGLFHFVGQAIDGLLFRRYILWRIGLLFSVLGVVFAFVGALLVVVVPARGIEIVLGAFFVLYAFFSLSGRTFTLPNRSGPLIIAGAVTGFLAGILGTAGALRTAVLSALRLKKEFFLGTSFAIAFFVDLTRVSVYLASGLLELNTLLVVAVLSVAIVGSLLGRLIVYRISQKTFSRLIAFGLLLAGVKFLLG